MPLRAEVMRALAHPTRIALIGALQLHPDLTATAASEVIGVTPTNCAFHLRALARFGLVEEVGSGPGRRRPWRLVETALAFSDVQPDDDSSLAARALSDVVVEEWLRRIRRVQAERHLEPVAWQDVLGGSQGVVFGTLEEVQQVLTDIRAILGRHDDRLRDPARRPAGARAIELLLFAQPHSPRARPPEPHPPAPLTG
jgi:predicted ArsR family transcriptional regulator